jgi:hypothetical protein
VYAVYGCVRQFTQKEVDQGHRFECTSWNDAGSRLAGNFCEVFVMPLRSMPNVPVQLRGVAYPELRRRITDAGYHVEVNSEVIVASKLDNYILDRLEKGARVLLLADSDDALPSGFGLNTTSRAGNDLEGRWFSNYNCVRTDRAPFRDVTFGRILGFESANVVPDYVIQGVSSADFEHDVLAVATFGWLQKTSALAMQARVGEGRLFATVFRFHQYGQDAYSTSLLNAFIRYVASGEFAPQLQLARAREHEQAD